MIIKDPPVEITPNLVALGTNEYMIYLYRGETEDAIFEGGVGAMGPVLQQQIKERGVAVEKVRQLVVTHGHPDHVMAVPLFRQLFPNLAVSASNIAAKTLLNEKAVSFFAKLDQSITGSLLKFGSIAEEHQPEPMTDTQIAIDRMIGEGDTIDVDGAQFRVLETPGHSDCSLSFHEPDKGILIVADATGFYMPELNEWWPMYFSNYGQFVESMKRLATLDAEVLCLSHNAAIRGGEAIKTFFQGAIESAETYHQHILEETRAGTAAEDLAAALGTEVHGKTSLLPEEFFQKNCALLVKNSLRHEGLIEES